MHCLFPTNTICTNVTSVLSTHEVFLVEVDERERKRDVERLILGRISGSLA